MTLTPSLNHRIFFLTGSSEVKINDYVLFTGSNKEPLPIIKRVSCVPGNLLEVLPPQVFCNKKRLGTLKTVFLNGTPAVPFIFNGIVPRESYFLMGDHKDSYDSRYLGFIQRNQIKAIAYPIF